MTVSKSEYNWATDGFLECYNSIKDVGSVGSQVLEPIKRDLASLCITPAKQSSTVLPEEVELLDGKYKINDSFREAATIFSSELNLDVHAAAELIHLASDESFKMGTELLDSARVLFFTRFDLILQIAGYFVSSKQLDLIVTDFDQFFNNLMLSFTTIIDKMKLQNELIDKQRATANTNSLVFIAAINYTKSELLHEHESLGKLLYSLIKTYPQQFATDKVFSKILEHLNVLDDNDILTVHYLPGIFELIYSCGDIEIEKLHNKLTGRLSTDYKKITSDDELNMDQSTIKPLEIVFILISLTRFIIWCKEEPERTKKYSFTDDILKYIEWTISYGAFEKLLCLAADTSKSTIMDDLYGFRSLLEKSIPRLAPLKLIYPNSDIASLFNNKFTISEEFLNNLVAPFLHKFFQDFIGYSAITLTSLRDSEEDFLLSSRKEKDDQIDLDEIASRADLERFYLAASYSYFQRPEIISLMWESGDIYGFIQWGISHNTSPLITATFCVLLGSLANEKTSIKIWEILVSSTTMKKNDFSKISGDSIIESLQYYIDALNNNLKRDLKEQKSEFFRLDENKHEDSLVVELAEDSVVFISGFIQLLSGIVNNMQSSEIKTRIWTRFKPIIESFLKFDNFAAQSSGHIRFLDDNRANLVCLMLQFLAGFVDENLEIRYEIWELIDKWIFQGFDKRGPSGRPIQLFLNSLTRLSQVKLFLNLLGKLFKPITNDSAFEPLKLLYPDNLGSLYRGDSQIGIWPYVEFILVEVFGKSNELEEEEMLIVQNQILSMTNIALKEIDWVFLCKTASSTIKASINFDTIVGGITFKQFLKLHHSVAFLSYLHDEKVYNVLFKVCDNDDKLKLQNITESISMILSLEEVYKTKIFTLLKNDSLDIPSSAGQGTSMSLALSKSSEPTIYYKPGLRRIDFCEILLFNLTIVATFGLLIGSNDKIISKNACKILDSLSSSPYFVGLNGSDSALRKDRLSATFATIDESTRIRFAFIQQIERPIDEEWILNLKFEILEFLLKNTGSKPSISHFLLGFDEHGDGLILNNSQNTLLKTLIYVLTQSLESISFIDFNRSNITVIEHAPAALSAKILELFVKLCKEPITASLTLKFLRNYEIENVSLFERLLSQPRIDEQTEWSVTKFDNELSSEFIKSEGPKTLIAFINQRNQLLQYFALELHNSNSQSMRRQLYIDHLLKINDFLDGIPKVLQFLDVGILNFDQIELDLSKTSQKYNLDVILAEMGTKLDLTILEKIFKLLCKGQHTLSKELRTNVATAIMEEGTKLTDLLLKCAIFRDFRAAKLASVHSWVQLIQVILSDSIIDASKRSKFVLEVFQTVLPRINDYLERDILFAEELISLCVLLFDIFQKDNAQDDAMTRLLPLFLTCIKGIMGSQASPDLRSDLYVILCRFLQKSVGNEELRMQLASYLRSAGNKLIDRICNDAVYAEGSPRITALVLLEQLVHISIRQRVDFVLDIMIKNNVIMLLTRSLKRTNEILALCSGGGPSGIDASNLLYELTAFKSTIYLLVRLASTRAGASQLLQCDLFPIIFDCKFLVIDPDVGLRLELEESKDHSIKVNLSLDLPLALGGDEVTKGDISYFEFLVPVFQLICSTLISMGPSYQPAINQGKKVLTHFRQVIVGVMKRDSLLENNPNSLGKTYGEGSVEKYGLKELVDLIILLDSLVNV